MVKPGSDSTEHGRALRAEKAGGVVLALGVLHALLGAWLDKPLVALTGVGLAALAAMAVAHVASAYSRSRGDVKAAAVRRPVDQAPRQI